MEHTAWLPEGCLPKGQPPEGDAESAPVRGNSFSPSRSLRGCLCHLKYFLKDAPGEVGL